LFIIYFKHKTFARYERQNFANFYLFCYFLFCLGLYEYKIPNTFGATAFCRYGKNNTKKSKNNIREKRTNIFSYGAFWCSFAAYVKFVVPNLPANQAHNATGIFLFAWTVFTVRE
jgi:succinate-acetate transporter protein